MPMNISQIETNLKEVMKKISKKEFIFDVLLAYGVPKATVTLLKKGNHNLSKQESCIILKRKLYFLEVLNNDDLHETIDILQNEKLTLKHSPRFIVVTDYKTLLAADVKTGEKLDIEISDLAKYYDFFLPWAGIEKHKHNSENPADRKAAERMAKLYDEILRKNNISDENRTHDLNIFLSRLLFCFFAEDTDIFTNGIFTDGIASHTQADGSDLPTYLDNIFEVLNTKDTSSYPVHFQKFPYVNGGLFKEKHWIPSFDKKSRDVIIECGELNWAKINPDIFGSMIQAVVHPGLRESLGMHYTSVPNIMKVIEPLFLNELRDEFENSKDDKSKLLKLIERIRKIKFFDPACGSGNFLIITYKELRRLEMQILKDLNSLAYFKSNLSNYYGIEIDDFAHEIAKLSLYLAEHQMNMEYKEQFGKANPTLPLGESGNIVCANATKIDWEKVCPKTQDDEIYILGNPPFEGARKQTDEQKKDLEYLFNNNFSDLDYVSAWYFKGNKYIQGSKVKMALVSTNSICQGQHVNLLWPRILKKDKIEICFAYNSFKWKNNAKNNAGVTCIIVGLRNISHEPKYLYLNNTKKIVKQINAYLVDGPDSYICNRSIPLSKLPVMLFGSMPNDDGNLFFTKDEMGKVLIEFPEANQIIKIALGAKNFLNGGQRYCLWIDKSQIELASSIPLIEKKIKMVEKYRFASDRKATQKLAKIPYSFAEVRYASTDAIIIPRHSSERRKYIPFGYLTNREVILDSALGIYNAEPWIFGIISSGMHMVWVCAVAGRIKTDYRYSSELCYNTFPIPSLTAKQKKEIERHAYTVLETREAHSEKTLSGLYDPDKMPDELRDAHHQLDLAVERLYRSKPFGSDEERLEYLFKLYQQMIDNEKVQ